jgi:hypothetical protein
LFTTYLEEKLSSEEDKRSRIKEENEQAVYRNTQE